MRRIRIKKREWREEESLQKETKQEQGPEITKLEELRGNEGHVTHLSTVGKSSEVIR